MVEHLRRRPGAKFCGEPGGRRVQKCRVHRDHRQLRQQGHGHLPRGAGYPVREFVGDPDFASLLSDVKVTSSPMHELIEPSCLRGLGADCRGAAAVMLALSLSSVLGLAGLSTEGGGLVHDQADDARRGRRGLYGRDALGRAPRRRRSPPRPGASPPAIISSTEPRGHRHHQQPARLGRLRRQKHCRRSHRLAAANAYDLGRARVERADDLGALRRGLGHHRLGLRRGARQRRRCRCHRIPETRSSTSTPARSTSIQTIPPR